MQYLFLIVCFAIGCVTLRGQGVSIGTSQTDPSAILEVRSTEQGVLFPRVTTVQRKAIPDPAPGLMVFDVNKHTIYLFDGNTWRPVLFGLNESQLPPFVVRPSDHDMPKSFGSAVAIDGDYAIIGALEDPVDGVEDRGSAYIFRNIDGVWTEQQKLIAYDGAEGDFYGSKVAIRGNYAAVAAPGDDIGQNVNQGAVYVYFRTDSTWNFHAKLIALEGMALDLFGTSLAMDGDRIVVGAPYKTHNGHIDKGAVYVFRRLVSGDWFQEAIVSPNGAVANDRVGISVDIDSLTLIIGVPFDDVDAQVDRGSAYIFRRENATWIQTAYLTASGKEGEYFGRDVALDDSLAIVGAPQADFGQYTNCGRVNFYKFNGTSWFGFEQVVSPDIQDEAQFGYSVSLSGRHTVIGSPTTSVNNILSMGKAYVYEILETGSLLVRDIVDQSGKQPQMLGRDVDIRGFRIVTSAPRKYGFRGEAFFVDIE